MSNKPCKHSELKKKGSTAKRMRASWGKPRSAVPTIRIRPERFLIVTEGTKTEPTTSKALGGESTRSSMAST